MFRFGFIRKAATVGTVFGLSLLGVAAAQAAPTANQVDPAQNGKCSINIVKYKQDATNGKTENTGLATPAPSGDKLENIKFVLQKVQSIDGTDISTLDYTKNATWNTLSGLVNATTGQPKANVVLNSTFKEEQTTNTNGEATFSGLDFGFYKVSEELLPTSPEGVSPAEPFYMVLPFATKTNPSQWKYDPTVFPKNTVGSISKTVDDTKVTGIGSEVTYTIKTSMSLPKGQATKKYVITDPMPDRVSYQSATVAFETSATPLVEGTDYDITPASAGPVAGPGGQKVVITFKQPGFDKMKTVYTADSSDHVVVTIKGVIVKVAGDNKGAISNTAYLIPDDNPKWTNDGMPSDTTPEVKTAQLKIVKQSAADNSVKLAGAEFKLYATEADATNGTNPVKVVDKDNNTVESVTTGADGVATMSGIRVSEYQNGTTASTAKKYYLVETVAPDGYALLSAPIEVVLKDNSTFVTEVPVDNTKSNVGLILGNTGANGPVLFAIVGVLLLSGALALYVAKQRKRNPAEQ